MRTTYPMLFIMALGVAGLMFSMSGYSDQIGTDPTAGLGAPAELEQQAKNSSLGDQDDDNQQDGFEGSAGSADDGEIVGFIISGGQAVADIMGMLVMLPWELNDMGFPWWFAWPIGLVTQIVGSIGIIQFATNRRLR